MFAAQRMYNMFNHVQNTFTNDQLLTSAVFSNGNYNYEKQRISFPKKQERKAGSSKGKGRKNNDNDGNGKNGGLLEPIIEDLKEWIGKRRPSPYPQGVHLYGLEA